MSPAIGSPPARRAGGSFAVVGSGVTGLAAAARLLERGFAVTLFESGPRTGGHISAAPFAGRTIDLGPEALGPGTDLDRLLERIGLAGSVCPGEEHEGLVAAARAGLGTLAAPAGLVGAYLDGPGIARAVSGVNRTVDAMTTEVITK